ncbi:MAG: gluconeogenesis factor YvcK family protein [Candidatus Dormibacteria bacterium]
MAGSAARVAAVGQSGPKEMKERLRPGQTLTRLLTPGLHVKRWLLLLMVGIVMVALAIGYVLRDIYYANYRFPDFVSDLTLQFLPRSVRGLLFLAVGVAIIGISFYFLGRSVLGPFLPGSSSEGFVQQLYTYRLLSRGPRVVAMGGGTGLSALLRGIKKYTGNIVAIVTVADDGGSSGRLREEFRVLPPGDFRQCLTALAETEPLMTDLFQHRFTGEGELGGHSFGNLFITAMTEITGDFEHAIRESGRVLAVRGAIVPSTLTDVVLCAAAGEELRVGESKVPVGDGHIDRVFLQPTAPPINPEAEAAVLDAEMIIIGPGSLYTSILPNLLVDGMVEALQASPAVKVYVCNVAGQPGETVGYTVSEHLDAIQAHVGVNLFDYVVVNSNLAPPLPPSSLRAGVDRVTFDRQRAQNHAVRYVLADVVSPAISSHHDPEKLARVVMKQIWRQR